MELKNGYLNKSSNHFHSFIRLVNQIGSKSVNAKAG